MINGKIYIVDVARVGGRVLIVFADGKAGMFSAQTLYALLQHADEMYESTAEVTGGRDETTVA